MTKQVARWTVARRAKLEAYVAGLAAELKLADWTIEVSWEPAVDSPDEVTLAQVLAQPRQRRAVLQVADAFLGLTPARQRQVLCHELVHCHLHPLEELARAMLADTWPDAPAAAMLGLTQQVEYVTDGLADALHAALGSRYPLPAFGG